MWSFAWCLASQGTARLETCTLGPNRCASALVLQSLMRQFVFVLWHPLACWCTLAAPGSHADPCKPHRLNWKRPPQTPCRRSVLPPTAVRLASRSREGSETGLAEGAAAAAATAGGGGGGGNISSPLQQAQQADSGAGAAGAAGPAGPAGTAGTAAAGGTKEQGGGKEAGGAGHKKGSSWWRRLTRKKGLQWSDYRIGAVCNQSWEEVGR